MRDVSTSHYSTRVVEHWRESVLPWTPRAGVEEIEARLAGLVPRLSAPTEQSDATTVLSALLLHLREEDGEPRAGPITDAEIRPVVKAPRCRIETQAYQIAVRMSGVPYTQERYDSMVAEAWVKATLFGAYLMTDRILGHAASNGALALILYVCNRDEAYKARVTWLHEVGEEEALAAVEAHLRQNALDPSIVAFAPSLLR